MFRPDNIQRRQELVKPDLQETIDSVPGDCSLSPRETSPSGQSRSATQSKSGVQSLPGFSRLADYLLWHVWVLPLEDDDLSLIRPHNLQNLISLVHSLSSTDVALSSPTSPKPNTTPALRPSQYRQAPTNIGTPAPRAGRHGARQRRSEKPPSTTLPALLRSASWTRG
ncbi:hypothetical protein CNYM01_03329 [Colletotrichum nymphaeae SA-01]|uniref:Uncharacterized protein n=1 Tax=Colletotrichum nymphaeae SA-01 TaxID=1460502 RepID=A0A135TQN5_9PEZI|nr:hypothetical protein CNYM01_03329 [Colletotrichum nymphaeae SA-01]